MSGPMNLVYPTPGDTQNTWGTVLNTAVSLVENHDHTAGKGVLVPSAGLGINADVSWASFAITAMKALGFTEVTAASVASYADALFVNSSDHNLYFRNNGGTNVQVTAGNTLNVSIVGGIGGDYSSVGALLSYVDASRSYLLQQEGSPRPWAALQTADILLYQKAASIVNAVTLKSPNALAAGYTLTMPTALPAATSPLYVSSAGQISPSASLTIQVTAAAADINGNTRVTQASVGMYAVQLTGGNGAGGLTTFPLPLQVGDVITSWKVYANKTTSNTSTITADLFFQTGGTGTPSQTGATASNSANNPGAITLTTSGLNVAVAAGTCFGIAVGMSAGAGTSDTVMLAEVTVTRGG